MINYIIREVEPEAVELNYYFDDEGLTDLFILGGRDFADFHGEEYRRIQREAEELAEEFNDIREHKGYNYYSTYKEAMLAYDWEFNNSKCHKLKEILFDFDEREPEDIAKYLTLKTGKQWDVDSARGYSQGDYVEMVYCRESFPNGVENYGEIWLGACKEFAVIDLDEAGNEVDACYGYIVADCEAWHGEYYKRLVCDWAGIPENETRLEIIEGYKTQVVYSYKTVA